ncbi:Hint domain-containing protein [Xenorhabdus sp. PB61.4]|uniref:Hint domain-containing protein n=1 Tax=Xenorhabdus sp. PB61.4 TaxID=2788940 RepID=UPI001E2EC707|nr:Hint domain-containing protein [Xenorhabdus sp. PB61.4]
MNIIKRFLTSFLFLLVTASFCYASADINKLSSQEHDNVKKFLKETHENSKGELHVIDLTVPENEKAYISILKLNGITKESHPEFFSDIETIKTRQKSTYMSGRGIQLSELDDKPSHYLGKPVVKYAKPDRTYVTGEVSHSIHYPDDSVPVFFQDMLMVYTVTEDGSTNELIASGSNRLENKGVRFNTTEAKSHTPEQPNNIDQSPIQANAVFQFNLNGIPYGPFHTSSKSADIPMKMENIAPEPKDPALRQDHKSTIIICLNRADPEPEQGFHEECDYGPMTPGKPNDQTHIQLEVIGSVTFEKPIVTNNGTPDQSMIDFTLIGINTGGTCKLRDISQDKFLQHVTIEGNGRTLKWDFSKDKGYADFGNICWANNSEYALIIMGKIMTADENDSDNKIPIEFTFSSAPNVEPSVNKLEYNPIVIQYGCIIEGTEIDMADGSKRKVEDLRRGDILLSKDGKILRIKSRIVGFDNNFIDLQYKHENDEQIVTLTPTHPVLSQRGIIRAEDLKAGDTVYTRNGEVTLDSVNKKNIGSQNVYNFILENTSDKDALLPNDALLYAGGVLVGDNILQGKLSIK